MSGENKKTILLVENEAFASVSWRKDLDNYGYTVIRVNSSERAIETAGKTAGIDLILMDIEPGGGMDGVHVAEQILEKHDLPLVFILSRPKPETLEKVENVTSYGFVTSKSSMAEVNSYFKMVLRLFETKKKMREELTEREKAKKALQESEEKYRVVFKNTGTAMCIIEKDGTLSWVNAKFADLAGYAIEEIENKKTWMDFVAKEDLERMREQHELRRQNKEEALNEYEFSFIDRNHNIKDIYLYIDMIPGSDKSVASLLDITERKKAERELIFQNVLMKTQLEVSLDGILIVDENDKIISFNQRFADIWGIPDSIMSLQSSEKALEYVLPKLTNPDEFAQRIHDLYENKQKKSYHEIALTDGKILERYSAPMFGSNDEYYGRIWYYRDITERKRTEEALRRSLKEKDVLLSEIHHRVKNNMAVISSMLALQSEFGDQKKDSDELLRNLQTRIMSMSWVHELVYESSNFDQIPSDKLLKRLADYLKSSYQVEGKEISMQVHSEDIMLDMNNSVPLTLLVAELLTNALKHAFTDRRTGQINLSIKKHEEGFRLVVQDDGIGVPDPDKLKSPESFGYTIIHGLAGQLRGELAFSSPPEGGLKVEAWFPEKGHIEKLTKAG